MFKKLKNAVSAWLNRLAKENKKAFPDGKADCCKLNDTRKKSS